MGKSVIFACVIAVSACSCSAASGGPTSTTSIVETTTTSSLAPTSTTTIVEVGHPSTEPFDVPAGSEGVTFEEDGAPPSGPSSFTILDDGSVVIADTMAAGRGEPRLLHFDRNGQPVGVIDLAQLDVASIVDVASSGQQLAVLDVFVAMNRYRVLVLSIGGDLIDVHDVPAGFRLENGLTGLEWDDEGPLLSFEFGAEYARLSSNGQPDPEVVLTLDGIEVEITRGSGRVAEVRVDEVTFEVERTTEFGGVTLVGLAPDRTLVLVVDEVDSGTGTIEVTRRLRRYTTNGQLVSETAFAAGQQYVMINHPLEMAADGEVFYLRATVDGVALVPESDLG